MTTVEPPTSVPSADEATCRSCGNWPLFCTVNVYVPAFSVCVAGAMEYSASLNVMVLELGELDVEVDELDELPLALLLVLPPPQANAVARTREAMSSLRIMRSSRGRVVIVESTSVRGVSPPDVPYCTCSTSDVVCSTPATWNSTNDT